MYKTGSFSENFSKRVKRKRIVNRSKRNRIDVLAKEFFPFCEYVSFHVWAINFAEHDMENKFTLHIIEYAWLFVVDKLCVKTDKVR